MGEKDVIKLHEFDQQGPECTIESEEGDAQLELSAKVFGKGEGSPGNVTVKGFSLVGYVIRVPFELTLKFSGESGKWEHTVSKLLFEEPLDIPGLPPMVITGTGGLTVGFSISGEDSSSYSLKIKGHIEMSKDSPMPKLLVDKGYPEIKQGGEGDGKRELQGSFELSLGLAIDDLFSTILVLKGSARDNLATKSTIKLSLDVDIDAGGAALVKTVGQQMGALADTVRTWQARAESLDGVKCDSTIGANERTHKDWYDQTIGAVDLFSYHKEYVLAENEYQIQRRARIVRMPPLASIPIQH